MYRISQIALFASLATASLLHRDVSEKACKKHPNGRDCESEYLQDICAPNALTADFNFDAPCNIGVYIAYECTYGQKIHVNNTGLEKPSSKPQSSSAQRLCVCESLYFDAVQGCEDCYEAHGAGLVPHSVLSSMSSAYCAATATPTVGILEFGQDFLAKPQFSSIFSSNSAAATSTFSDPIGNKTDVTLYWTAPVSGTAILDVGAFTGTAKPTTTNVQNGQIVATASTSAQNTAETTAVATTGNLAGTAQTGASQSTGTTTTSGIAARQTEAVFAGVLGLVGVVAML